jgi:hypothetical protein
MSKAPVKQVRISLDTDPTGMGSPGLAPAGNAEEGFEFQAIGMYRNPEKSSEYLVGTFTIKNGQVIQTSLEVPCEYRIAAMTAKVLFSRLFLTGELGRI